MRAGIYLGPRSSRARRLGRLLVVAGVMGTVFHVGLYLRESSELGALRADVERRRSGAAGALSEPGINAREDRATLARLGAVFDSGAATTVSATELLQLIAGALPDDVALAGLSLEASSPRPSLLVDAVARREEDVTALERRIGASERVVATRLLGERRGLDGTFSIRLQVDLSP